MQLPVFEQAYLLKSLGWAIANSFWQTGSLWLLYQCITNIDKRLPALVKHHLSLVLLITSFIWFIFTILQNYRLLTDTFTSPEIFLHEQWVLRLQPFNNALPFLSIVYLLLLCFYTTRFLKNLSANRFLQTQGLTKAPIDFRIFTTKTALHLGIKKKIQVWLSEHVDVPSVTGFIKPVILLPAAIINHLSIQQTEAILLHELAHIKRNDYLVNFFQSVVELILFFNPFAVLLSKAARKERENCCDDWVMNFQYNHYEYAKALLVLEEQRHFLQFRFALAATNGKKNLLQRVKRLFNTDPQTNFSSFQKFKFIGLCFLLLTGMFTVLPYMTNKPASGKPKFSNKMEKLNLVKIDKLPKEIALKDIFKSVPIKSVNEKEPVATSSKTKKLPAKGPTEDYVNAFINEELLNPISQVEPIVSQAVEKEIKDSKFVVKIEEQQSGKKQVNTYYFELNNKDGNAAIKPLIMLNKIKASAKKTLLGNLRYSLDTLIKQATKKKITS
jgi:beta-lactamase regulating signal transducer with metallopeptidase domain